MPPDQANAAPGEPLTTKIAGVLLPSLLAFGPVFMVIGVPATPSYYSLIGGALMLGMGCCILIAKVSKLEKRIAELEKKSTG